MDVILLERIEKLGAIGDVVKVKNGYARNFLLPNGKALRANESNRKVFESNRERIEATNAERDRKSTRLNSSHGYISYAVFCLKKKKKTKKKKQQKKQNTKQRTQQQQ